MKLIVFVGPRNSGKDTCASIVQEMGAGPTVKFAGPLKSICSNLFGIPLADFEDATKKEAAGEYRITSLTVGSLAYSMQAWVPMTQKEERDALRAFANHVGTILSTPRQVLQYVGTEMIRAVDGDWHCKAAFSGVSGDLTDDFVVTDCRFPNEYDFLVKNHAPTFYYVERPLAEAQLNAATHASELEILKVREKIGNVIHNTGTVDDLRAMLQQIFKGEACSDTY